MKFYSLLIALLALNLSANDAPAIANGKEIYNSVCFACHGKKLEGATGPKLTDYNWLHGGSKDQIMASIKKGFPEKGMVSFGTVFKDEQLSNLADFILSRQHGLRTMEYKVYHGATVETGVDWQNQKPDKQLTFNFPRVNLNLPEVDQFGLSFKGRILISEHLAGDYTLKGLIRQQNGFEILIDNKKLNIAFKDKVRFEADVNLAKGYHDFEFRYIRNFKDGTLLLDLIGKGNIPISGQSIQKSMTSSHIVKANDSFTIQRKRIAELPSGSIVVNHQDRVSYAINPKDASVNAIWSGESLDIGPNIYARGQDKAKILGKHLYSLQEDIELLLDGDKRQLQFIGYANKPRPKFMYKFGPHEISIETFMSVKGLVLKYSLGSQAGPKIKLKLPRGLKVEMASDDQTSFQLTIPFEEAR
jgi:cytochrome c5